MWLIVVAFLWLASNTAHAQILCTADFSAMGQGLQTVSVRLKPEGSFEASVNGLITNADGSVVDEPVRPGLNMGADPYGAEFASFNGAERSLVHLQRVLAIPEGRGLVQVPFPLSSVHRLRTFDLAGKTDKFGGHVLLEALDDRGNILGRVVRRVFVAPCHPQPAQGAPVPASAASVSTESGARVIADTSLGRCFRRPPRYPVEALRKDQTGRTVVALTVAADGAIGDLSLRQSSGHAALDQAALEHVGACVTRFRVAEHRLLPSGTYAVPFQWRIE